MRDTGPHGRNEPLKKRLRVLVVENSRDDADLILRQLGRGDFEITSMVVEDPEAMRTAFQIARWDLVLSDFTLPLFSGLEAFRLLREEKLDIPFIVVSGTVGEETAIQTMKAGVHDFLMKGDLARLIPAVERELAEAESRHAHAVQYAVTRILAEAPTIAALGPAVLEAIASPLGWELGELWLVDPNENVLRCAEVWEAPGRPLADFSASTRGLTFAPGAGLPGEVWSSGRALPENSGIGRSSSARATDARPGGPRSSFGFPILNGTEVIGVAGFHSNESVQAGESLVRTLTDVGSHLGQCITRHRAEGALRSERGFLRALLDTLGEGIVACDAAGVLTLFNRASREFHGLPEQPMLPEEWAEHYDVFLPDGKTRLTAEEIPLRRALRGETVENVEILLLPKQGTPRRLLVSGRPIVDERGEKLGAVVAMHDVTERKLLEEQFRQAQKMEALGRLAGGIAHDFNNLLTSILSYSELVQHAVPAGSSMDHDIREVTKAGDRATALTRQLLAFSRRQLVEPKVLDLNVVVAEVDRMVGRLIGKDVELVTLYEPQPCRIKADPGQLDQVLMNLVVNACDAMPGGGRITIETRNIELDEAYARQRVDVAPGPYVLLSVTDTGSGIDPKKISRIFEPFYTTKEEGKGTGLGLSTVYGIVRQSGGHIVPQSTLGAGTTFRIYFPRTAASEVEEISGSQEVLGGGVETILLVEDDDAVRYLAERILTESGYLVLQAENANAALALAKGFAGDIQLLLTDAVLPGLSGARLSGEMRAFRPGLRVLLMSGYSEDFFFEAGENTPEGGKKKKDVAFLQKPFSPDSLNHAVRLVLDEDV